MTLIVVLAVAAAVAWYLQDRQRPGAGSSADARARHLRTPLVRLADLMGIKTTQGALATRSEIGADGERRTAARLRVLQSQGWTVLHDLGLPTGQANLDHLAISPGGVVVLVDSKLWSSRYTLSVVGGRLRHGTRDVTDRLNGLRHETRVVARVLGCPVIPLVSMDGAPIDGPQLIVDGIRIVPADDVVQALRAISRGRTATGPHPAERAVRLLHPHGAKRR
ncbi:nuclease-related domain-containing protein [Streptomyces sp. NPDC012617]|uniref:nuclease-related domain-containing protein n=1 Tax=Streptomyces TaxID=1883 RepID=UPI0033FE0267